MVSVFLSLTLFVDLLGFPCLEFHGGCSCLRPFRSTSKAAKLSLIGVVGKTGHFVVRVASSTRPRHMFSSGVCAKYCGIGWEFVGVFFMWKINGNGFGYQLCFQKPVVVRESNMFWGAVGWGCHKVLPYKWFFQTPIKMVKQPKTPEWSCAKKRFIMLN